MTTVEWVETTGRTLEEAKDAALDELGVDERDAEFEVVEEPRSGLFGRVRQEARVRARVARSAPRPKADRRDRRRRRPEGAGQGGRAVPPPPAASAKESPRPRKESDEPVAGTEEYGDEARTFLEGLLAAFEVDGRIEVTEVDTDTLEAAVLGDDLGLLIGPRGQTLDAVQELTRTAARRAVGRGPLLRVDVGGYRRARHEALDRFAHQVAAEVLDSGNARTLEAMGAADRKVVHDAVNTVEGVTTLSEGEEPARRVTILAEGD